MLAWMPAFAGITEAVISAFAGIQCHSQRALCAIHPITETHPFYHLGKALSKCYNEQYDTLAAANPMILPDRFIRSSSERN